MAKEKVYRYLVFLKDKGAVPVEGVTSISANSHITELYGEGYTRVAIFDNDAISGWVRQGESLPDAPPPVSDDVL